MGAVEQEMKESVREEGAVPADIPVHYQKPIIKNCQRQFYQIISPCQAGGVTRHPDA